MGQYFKIVNLDKKEYIHPHSIDSGAKLWEICANNVSRLLPYVLRRSSETGGGDVDDPDELQYCGRWAGDAIIVVGDYDDSGLYEKVDSDEWVDISKEVAKEFNEFIGDQDMQIDFKWLSKDF